jgi:imidazoleglycerol phosphate dehydratase HisB
LNKKRAAEVSRKTKETDIAVKLSLDGKGESRIVTGIHFFDHMLTLFAKHGLFDMEITCAGDLEVDGHHTVEDVGIALGEAFHQALGSKESGVPFRESWGHEYRACRRIFSCSRCARARQPAC